MRWGLVVLVGATALTLAACTSAPAETPNTSASAASTFTIDGSFTYGLGYATKTQFPEGSPCDFETPITGQQVAVSNQSGEIVATGSIGAGKTTWVGNQGECEYAMTVSSVPGTEKFYKLHVDSFVDTDYLNRDQAEHYQWKANKS